MPADFYSPWATAVLAKVRLRQVNMREEAKGLATNCRNQISIKLCLIGFKMSDLLILNI